MVMWMRRIEGVSDQSDTAKVFQALHDARDAFLIPNPWDGGSAVALERAGFKALATTSAGFARSLGRDDGEISLEEKLDHCRQLVSVTSIPITVDFENGFADNPQEVAGNIVKLAETGVVGGSVEDWSAAGSYDFDLAVERVAAAAEASAGLPFNFMLTARAEGLLRKTGDLDEIIRRLQAFEAAGADVLYAPGLRTVEEVGKVLGEVSRPINVLSVFLPNVTQSEFADMGVARMSLGGALAGHANQALKQVAENLLKSGRMSG